ncbi:flagellar hook-length control protein FliK [Vreelandella olivaria]|uniref:flagellar hook-length control protein FliK n=1 Tax=Vreelandella olivaria TaxID=390919 RepID=UPI00201EEDAB|nr:flagellar hook-length control protein FliK [Halomonas olivaria]
MNIQLLLSATQSQGSTSLPYQQISGSQSVSQDTFRQALIQAADAPPRLLKDMPADDSASGQLSTLTELLTSLGIELDDQALAELMVQLQSVGQPSAHPDVDLDELTETPLSPLDEIAARLSLVASFSDPPAAVSAAPIDLQSAPQIGAIAKQFNISTSNVIELVNTFNVLRDGLSPLAHSPDETNRHRAPLVSTDPSLLTASRNSSTPLPLNLSTGSIQLGSEVPPAPGIVTEAVSSPSRGGESPLTPLATPPSSTTVASVMTTTAALSTPVNSPAWPSQLGQQLVQFAQRGGEQHVQMQLHPAELGPLSISLKVSEQGTQAHFLSAQAQVRQVIELAIPQLREALAEQGISLGETSVGEQHNPHDQAFAQQGSGASTNSDNGIQDQGETAAPSTADSDLLTLDGRVDLYA